MLQSGDGASAKWGFQANLLDRKSDYESKYTMIGPISEFCQILDHKRTCIGQITVISMLQATRI